MPYVTHNIARLSRTQHFATRDAHEHQRREYLERLARQHAKRTGLSLPVARRIVTVLSITANKPMPEGRDYAHVEDALTRDRIPSLNTMRKLTSEEDAQIRALAAEGLPAAAIARRLQRADSVVTRRARSLGIELARGRRGRADSAAVIGR
jgi:hypothetical protein